MAGLRHGVMSRADYRRSRAIPLSQQMERDGDPYGRHRCEHDALGGAGQYVAGYADAVSDPGLGYTSTILNITPNKTVRQCDQST